MVLLKFPGRGGKLPRSNPSSYSSISFLENIVMLNVAVVCLKKIKLVFFLLLGCLMIAWSAGCHHQAPGTPESKAATISEPLSVSTPKPSPTASPQVVPEALTGLTSSLVDEVKDLPEEKIAWSTYWQLCWQVHPSALAYELETFTGEGAARKLRRQTETCFRTEIAKSRNDKAKGLFNRDLILAGISGQLSYRVRAVFDGNRVSAWSPLMEAGKAVTLDQTAPNSSPKKRGKN